MGLYLTSNPLNVHNSNEIAEIVGQCLYSVYPLVSRIFVTFLHNWNALAFPHSVARETSRVASRRRRPVKDASVWVLERQNVRTAEV